MGRVGGLSVGLEACLLVWRVDRVLCSRRLRASGLGIQRVQNMQRGSWLVRRYVQEQQGSATHVLSSCNWDYGYGYCTMGLQHGLQSSYGHASKPCRPVRKRKSRPLHDVFMHERRKEEAWRIMGVISGIRDTSVGMGVLGTGNRWRV